jgi:hypothetical protein
MTASSPILVINGHGVSDFNLMMPDDGMWVCTARLAGPLPGVVVGSIVTLEAINANSSYGLQAKVQCEVTEYSDSNTGRWTIELMPLGYSQLTQKMSSFIKSPTAQKVVSTLWNGQFNFISTPPQMSQDNLVIPSSLTRWQSLRRHMDMPIKFHDVFSTSLDIGHPQQSYGELPGSYYLVDYDASKQNIVIALNDCINPEPHYTIYGARILEANVYSTIGADCGVYASLHISGSCDINVRR